MDRHLLPEEIDQLLDGDVGFGTAPLKAHARVCPQCRAELEGARALVRQLEYFPLLSPSTGFADRVMADVQIYVPWYVALSNTVRGWLPQSKGGRAIVWAGLGVASIALTVLSIWMLTNLDTVMFAADMALDRVQSATVGAISGVVAMLFGSAATHALRSTGVIGMLLVVALMLVSVALAARVLRAAVAGARRR